MEFLKTIGSIFLLIFVVFFLAVIGTWAQVNNGFPNIFEKIWPEKFVNQEDMQAIDSMTAPFPAAEGEVNAPAVIPGLEYKPLGDQLMISETLDVPHRSEASVSGWLNQHVSEAMSFTLQSFEKHKTDVTGYMTTNGYSEFMAFLEQTQVLGLMQTKGYEVTASIINVPELMNAGVAGGSYRWVYDVPLLLTFKSADLTTYKDPETPEYRAEALLFRFQLTRVPEGQGDDGLAIDTWQVLKRLEE